MAGKVLNQRKLVYVIGGRKNQKADFINIKVGRSSHTFSVGGVLEENINVFS
jgi:hypothetical protein